MERSNRIKGKKSKICKRNDICIFNRDNSDYNLVYGNCSPLLKYITCVKLHSLLHCRTAPQMVINRQNLAYSHGNEMVYYPFMTTEYY